MVTELAKQRIRFIIFTMERLFTPSNRLRGILESQGYVDDFEEHDWEESVHELNLNVSTEELLSAERAFTYADLYAMVVNGDTVAWLTPGAVVVRENTRAMGFWHEQDDESYHFSFGVDCRHMVVFARSFEHLLEMCDVILRLLAVSVVHSVHLIARGYNDASINAPSLGYLMEQCLSLKFLILENQKMDENHCRVLGAFSRPDLEIVLDRCAITSTGTSALAEVLGRNQGPTKLYPRYIDNCIIANGLRGNSRLKSWRPLISNNPDVSNRIVLAIADALKENKGLVDLDLDLTYRMSDETWGAICDSLKTHPTLQVLNLRARTGTVEMAPLAPAVLQSRIQLLLAMLKVNMSIHTIRLDPQYSRHEFFQRSVIPYLETNRFRPHLLAIQQTRPITYRAKVLGRALLSARTDGNRFWMLLSGNAEVAFPSTSATIAVAASLPTPATAAATSTTANAVAVVTISPATAASSVVAPASGQKRKACP
jgi:hypothetical protein